MPPPASAPSRTTLRANPFFFYSDTRRGDRHLGSSRPRRHQRNPSRTTRPHQPQDEKNVGADNVDADQEEQRQDQESEYEDPTDDESDPETLLAELVQQLVASATASERSRQDRLWRRIVHIYQLRQHRRNQLGNFPAWALENVPEDTIRLSLEHEFGRRELEAC